MPDSLPNQGAIWDSRSSRWDTGLRWAPLEPGPTKPKKMAKIAINTSGLTIPQQLAKGQEIITKSTGNPNAPGNVAVLAAFNTAQATFAAKTASADDARKSAKEATAARDEAQEVWNQALTALAGFTEGATGGVESKILSTGFDVRALPTPPLPVQQVMDVRVSYNGVPGYSKVQWKAEPSADAYMVQCCQDPITEAGWKGMGTVVGVEFQGNGATPGLRCWYRIAGVNRLGQGPWSEPALRPVM